MAAESLEDHNQQSYASLARLIASRNQTLDFFVYESGAIEARLFLRTKLTKRGLLGPIASFDVEDEILFLRHGDWRKTAEDVAKSYKQSTPDQMTRRSLLVVPQGHSIDPSEFRRFSRTGGGLLGIRGWIEVYVGGFDETEAFITHKRCMDLANVLEKGVKALKTMA